MSRLALPVEEFNNINNKDDIERIGNFINNELMNIISIIRH